MHNFKYEKRNKCKNFYEGWYLKIVDENNHTFIFIFGVSLYFKDPHAFIQIIDSSENKSYYFRFDKSNFYYNNEAIRIKDNILGINKLKLKVEPFDIDLNIKPTILLNGGLFKKSIMSIFKNLPLPTQHEIIFMNAKVEGKIKNKDNSYVINGNGYMEKNYGTKFPNKWLWVQTNNFKNFNTSLVLAKADLLCNFSGFFCVLNVDGDEFRYATYTGHKMTHKTVGDDIKITIEKGDENLLINIKYVKGALLVAPTCKAKMEKEIEESFNSTLTLSLYKGNELIYHDEATNVGCENLYLISDECKKAS